jgi:hypothetical protein
MPSKRKVVLISVAAAGILFVVAGPGADAAAGAITGSVLNGLPGMMSCTRVAGPNVLETVVSMRDIPTCDHGLRSEFDAGKMQWVPVASPPGERRGELPWCLTGFRFKTVFRW